MLEHFLQFLDIYSVNCAKYFLWESGRACYTNLLSQPKSHPTPDKVSLLPQPEPHPSHG